MMRIGLCMSFAFLFVTSSTAADAVTLKELIANPALLKDNCELLGGHEYTLDGKPIRVEAYRSRNDPNDYMRIMRVQFQQKEVAVPVEKAAYPFMAEYGPQVGRAPAPILLINNGNGGNAWNANQYWVVSLSDKSPAKLLGRVSHYEKGENSDLDLYVTDDIWELGLEIFGHADAPYSRVYLNAKDGQIVVDSAKTRTYAEKQIQERTGEIEKLKPRVIEAFGELDTAQREFESSSQQLLRAMLTRYLAYRDMGEQEKGWKILQEDLRFYNPEKFPVRHFETIDGKAVWSNTIPVTNLQKRLIQSLKKEPFDKQTENEPFDQWLKRVTSPEIDYNM